MSTDREALETIAANCGGTLSIDEKERNAVLTLPAARWSDYESGGVDLPDGWDEGHVGEEDERGRIRVGLHRRR